MNLNKLLLTAAILSASVPVFAVNYAIWPAATGEDVQIPVEYDHWYNFTSGVVEINGVSATKCNATETSETTASAGWKTKSTDVFDFSVIAPMDLVFDAMVEGSGKWNVRLTTGVGQESDVTISIPADGEFHRLRYNVQTDFPSIYEKWLAGESNGKDVFPFSLVGSELSSDAAIYFTGCHYEEAVPQPSISAEVRDVTSESAFLTYQVTFPEGYTNTVVKFNGSPAVASAELTLTGLEHKTVYTNTIEAQGQYNGETYTAEKVVTFKTARAAGDNPIWYGTTSQEGFSVEYLIKYNDDKTLYVEATIETAKETPAANRNFYITSPVDEWLKLVDDGTGLHTGTTQNTFEDGAVVRWRWYLPYDGGVYQEDNTYVVGSENEAPLAVRITASATNVTFNSADIEYAVTCPVDYKVYYKTPEGEAVEATESPIRLTNLQERTEYTYEVYAVATVDGESVESRHATVVFKTSAENAVDFVYADLFSVEIKNAYLIGEDETTMRRSFFVTLPWSVTYKADETAVYAVDLSSIEQIVGLNPQIYWNGFQQLTKNNDTGLYEYDFGTQTIEDVTAISHYFAYNGGVVDSRTPYTNWGMEKESPVLGDPLNLILSVSNEVVKLEESILLTVIATDAAGYYLPVDDVEITSSDTNVFINGMSAYIKDTKGWYTITAIAGGLSAEARVLAIASPEADNLIFGMKGVTDETYIQNNTSVDNVTDADRNTQLEWSCSETSEHYLIFDLAGGEDESAGYYVEAVEVFFEGAYATAFTVTLSSDAPQELDASSTLASREAATEDVVFNNSTEGVQHYFTQTPTAQHRYVTLRTQEALNTDWGIKVRDMKVYGTLQKPTGIEDVIIGEDDANAPVEYYNLNGVRVSNPSAGLYIRRQGSTVSKVLIK